MFAENLGDQLLYPTPKMGTGTPTPMMVVYMTGGVMGVNPMRKLR